MTSSDVTASHLLSQAETNSCISQMSLAERRPVTVSTWFMPLVYALPNGPDPDIFTWGSFICPLLTGHFVGCKSHAAGAIALFSARENASSCARLVPRSDCTLTLIYHPFVVLALVFAFSANLQLMSEKNRSSSLLLLL